METKELFYQLGATFSLLAVLTFNYSAFTMKRAGLWDSVKAFGIEVPNWSLHKSWRSFWSDQYLVKPQVKDRLYFQWKLGFMFILLGLISFLLSAFG
ncbi:hypothetical protein [Gimesia sp.]|uniref:hypothetical protein n=1 Tax=Gimesia sp. TaxID=2024833 RepID=UPI003A8FDDEB